MRQVYLASDHGGFVLKQALKPWLERQGFAITDVGPYLLDPDDDYPLYAAEVARRVSANPTSLGVLLCRSGQGVTIVANKFAGVRAALVWNDKTAEASRADDAANVLCLPADELSEGEARSILQLWLATMPKTDERYHRRVREIKRIEEETMGH